MNENQDLLRLSLQELVGSDNGLRSLSVLVSRHVLRLYPLPIMLLAEDFVDAEFEQDVSMYVGVLNACFAYKELLDNNDAAAYQKIVSSLEPARSFFRRRGEKLSKSKKLVDRLLSPFFESLSILSGKAADAASIPALSDDTDKLIECALRCLASVTLPKVDNYPYMDSVNNQIQADFRVLNSVGSNGLDYSPLWLTPDNYADEIRSGFWDFVNGLRDESNEALRQQGNLIAKAFLQLHRGFPAEEFDPSTTIVKSDASTESGKKNELSSSVGYLSSNQSIPETPAATDKLNRQKLVNALAINLTHSTNTHHRAIGLLGEWGSGKSTVLDLLKKRLKELNAEQTFVFGEFNAWAYEHTDNIQAGVAQEMINALTSAPESVERKVKDKPGSENKKTVLSFGLIWNKLCSLIHKLPDLLTNYLLMDIRDVRAGFVSFVTRRKLCVTVIWLGQRAWLTLQFSVKTHPFEILKISVLLLVAAMPWFTDWFDGLIKDNELAIFGQWVWSGGLVLYTLREFGKLIISPQAKELLTYLRLPSYAEHLGKIPVMRRHISTLCELRLKEKNGKTPRLLFVVDDLDRCSPEAIVKVLEAVRLVLDLENVIVLIAIDQHIALAALSKHFNDFAAHHKLKNSHAIAREYLSKVINLPIVLTAPSGGDVQVFMVDLWKDMPKASPVGAGDPDQKVPVDNSPAPSSSEMNLPVVDSTPEPDSVPVTDVSPGSDHTEGVKSKATEDDKQATAKVNPINALSPEQQASFIYWANYFELTNPRQLKRLNNSYDLMRSYLPQWDKEVVEFALTEVDVLKVYPMLLTLILMEYLNSLHSLTERSQLWEKLFSEPVIAGFESAKVGIPRVKVTEINNKRVTSEFVKAYRSLLAAEGNKSLVSNVEAFVLPAMT